MSNGNMIPAGSMPPEARSNGSLNATTSAKEREVVIPTVLDSGPKRGEANEYLPATYRTKTGSIRQDR